jgi:signal recognition particle GTPase
VAKISKKKHKFPEDLTIGQTFADDINNIYPIDDIDSIRKSAKALKNSDFANYTPKERFFIIDRIRNEAIAKFIFDDEIKNDLIYGGTMEVYNKEDFEKAVKAEIESKIAEFKGNFEKDTEKDKIVADLNEKIVAKDKDIEISKATIADLQKKNEELVKADDTLKSQIRDRDRMVMTVNEFGKINLSDEIKKNRIDHVLSIAKNYGDEDFGKFLKSEIEFYSNVSKVADLVNESEGQVVISAGNTKIETEKEKLTRYIMNQK